MFELRLNRRGSNFLNSASDVQNVKVFRHKLEQGSLTWAWKLFWDIQGRGNQVLCTQHVFCSSPFNNTTSTCYNFNNLI